MVIVPRNITLDVSGENKIVYYAKQNDALSRFLKVRLVNGGTAVHIDAADKIIFTVARSDGKKILGYGTSGTDGTCTVEFTSSMLKCTGEGECELTVVSDSGAILTSISFVLVVEEGLRSDDAAASSNEFPIFTKAIADMARLEKELTVFEAYDETKTYLKGNKVSYGGSSYVLVVDEVTGVSPDDYGKWLLIASKGDKGEPGKDGDAPDGVMSYAGEVEALPDEARAGELYKLIKYKLIVTRLRRSTNGLSIGEYAENQVGAFELYYEEDSVISKYLQACINKDVKIQIDDTVLTVSVWNASNTYALLGNYNAPEVPAFSDYITYWCEDVPCDNDEYAPDWVVDGYSDEPDTFRYVLYNGTEFEVLSDITQISGLKKQLGEKSDKGHEHSAGDISTGTLSVSRGGTGKSSFSANRIIYPSSSGYLSQLAFPSKESVLVQKSSGAPYWKPISDLSGGFKKIGFTADCDYIVASASSALSVFRTAIAEASDGDTILIMPGTYGAGDNTGELEISKNLNFVGIRMPIINFPVNIPCTTTYDDTDYTFIYGDSYKVGFQGIRFLKSFVVGIVTGPGECDASDVICDGCHFTVPSMEISGTFYNCFFDVEGTIRTGSYYGETSTFYNCDISCGGFYEADVYAYGCDIHFNGDDYSTFGGGGSYFDCNIHMNKSGLDDSCDHMNIIFERCRFYGYDFDRIYGKYTECYKVSETKF